MRRQVEDEIKAITDVIKETVDCEKIYLFGSYAYGEPTADSDLDFYVVLPDDSEQPLEVMQQIYRNLGKTKRVLPIDILANHAARFADLSTQPTMQRKIVREGVVLYERNGFSQQVV
ncbi:MAG: nucleotidyltransferase domain-containing protein [Gracilibacteraceae bacterium]|jgi:predicted nucleotidyltransferase|nr:nucleotidyltransferase domain-containing protein [Gracilibacteraceae bacterium]